MLGIAVGNIGMSYNDFCGLTPDEFSHINKAYSERQEAQYKDNWKRMRMLATIVVQPHVKGKLTHPETIAVAVGEAKGAEKERAGVSETDYGGGEQSEV